MPLDILLADEDKPLRRTLGKALTAHGHTVATARDGREALERIGERSFDVVVSDVLLPRLDGLEILRRLQRDRPETDVILTTAHGSVPDAVQALKDGAAHYLVKPFEPEQLLHELERLEERQRLFQQLNEARRALAVRRGGPTMIGRSAPMRRLFERLEMVSASEAPVLVLGESGTGKELVARALHERSARSGRPFVAVNCAAFPDTLIEAELFGHERGAFTGATRAREGRFKAAHGGTLFLDEVAELPLQSQAKLLRVLQEGVFEPLGSDTPVKVDVRVVSATHRDLRARIADGRFREDLLYRLKVLVLRTPPLRDRAGDLTLLVEHFLSRFSPRGAAPELSERAWAALGRYSFPGNVRELEHAIHHAVVLSGGGPIQLMHLPAEIAGDDAEIPGEHGLGPLSEALRRFEREYILRALEKTGGHKTRAAEVLGISRKNLWEKLKSHGIG